MNIPITISCKRTVLLLAACALLSISSSAFAQTTYQLQSDSKVYTGVPQGEMLQFNLESKKYYPGSKSTVLVYIPKEYNPATPACLYVGLDGPGFNITNVLDNLIYKKQMPVTIGVFVPSGSVNAVGKSQVARWNRCFEYDSTNDRFDKYLFNEVMPQVEQQKTSDGRVIRISTDPSDHMIAGGSSGGVCAFTAAWQHPDLFRRVFTAIGTYVGMRGADEYPTLIRKTEPKPIRIFLQDGAVDSWNPLFDNWFTQNKSMEESLSYAGYDVNHNWGVLGHEGSHADSLFPSAMKWMWRDYPAPIQSGVSNNSMQRGILATGETWHQTGGLGILEPSALTVDPSGSLYFADLASGVIYKCIEGGAPTVYARPGAPVAAEAFGHDGVLYVSQPSLRRIVAISSNMKQRVIESGIAVKHLTVLASGTIYASEAAPHDDMPSTIWRFDPNGHKTAVDTGLMNATGVIVTGDHNELFAAESRTHWLYSFEIGQTGELLDKQRYYWLHTAEGADDEDDDSAGTSDLAEDSSGYIYAATRMGVQVCDQNGRVESILTIPDGAVTSLSFFGKNLDTLAVVCGGKLYTRTLNVHGHPGFADVITLPNFGAG